MNAFTSNFAPHIEAMLEWRTSLGHSPRDMRNAMTGFDRFCSSRHPSQTVLTRELATAWCRDTATGTWGAYRSRAVREFGKYLQLIGVDGFIARGGREPAGPTRTGGRRGGRKRRRPNFRRRQDRQPSLTPVAIRPLRETSGIQLAPAPAGRERGQGVRVCPPTCRLTRAMSGELAALGMTKLIMAGVRALRPAAPGAGRLRSPRRTSNAARVAKLITFLSSQDNTNITGAACGVLTVAAGSARAGAPAAGELARLIHRWARWQGSTRGRPRPWRVRNGRLRLHPPSSAPPPGPVRPGPARPGVPSSPSLLTCPDVLAVQLTGPRMRSLRHRPHPPARDPPPARRNRVADRAPQGPAPGPIRRANEREQRLARATPRRDAQHLENRRARSAA